MDITDMITNNPIGSLWVLVFFAILWYIFCKIVVFAMRPLPYFKIKKIYFWSFIKKIGDICFLFGWVLALFITLYL